MSFWRKLLTDDSGPTAVEYAVMLALILMSVITTVAAVGASSGGMWGNVDSQLNATGFGG